MTQNDGALVYLQSRDRSVTSLILSARLGQTAD